jgi:hypothetical protein
MIGKVKGKRCPWCNGYGRMWEEDLSAREDQLLNQLLNVDYHIKEDPDYAKTLLKEVRTQIEERREIK